VGRKKSADSSKGPRLPERYNLQRPRVFAPWLWYGYRLCGFHLPKAFLSLDQTFEDDPPHQEIDSPDSLHSLFVIRSHPLSVCRGDTFSFLVFQLVVVKIGIDDLYLRRVEDRSEQVRERDADGIAQSLYINVPRHSSVVYPHQSCWRFANKSGEFSGQRGPLKVTEKDSGWPGLNVPVYGRILSVIP